MRAALLLLLLFPCSAPADQCEWLPATPAPVSRLPPAVETLQPLAALTGKLAASDGRTCDARAFGAKGDGVADDTLPLQSAIEACARNGGGIVLLEKGVFLSGTLRLRSGIELRIRKGATLKGKQDTASYPRLDPPTQNTELKDARRALLYAESAVGVKITGGGTIDGSGQNPAWKGHESTRPMGIFLALSKDIAIEDVTVKDAGMWAVVGLESENVAIRKITVDSVIFPNRDGIDMVDSHHVLIEDSVVSADDDAICLKSGSAKGIFDVTVRNTVIKRTGSNALKLGTASHGSFEKVRFEHIRIEAAYKAAMAVMSVDGGQVRDVEFRDIQFQNTGAAIFLLLGRRLLSPKVGSIEGVRFRHIRGSVNQAWGSVISGTQGLFREHRVGKVSLEDVEVRRLVPRNPAARAPFEYLGQYPDPPMWGDLPTDSVFLRHAPDVEMRDVRFLPPGTK